MTETFFFSYSRADKGFAQQLAGDLRDAGVAIWIDVLDITPGERWDRAVEAALQRCAGLLVVLSPTSVGSRPVMDEVSFALDKDKTIVPVIAQKCEIPFRLHTIQHVDFVEGYEEALQSLVRALGASHGPPLDQEEPRDTPGAVPAPKNDVHLPSRRSRVRTALATGLTGTVLSGILQVMIFANDTREDVWSYAVVGTLIAGLGWAIAGFVAGPRRVPLLFAGLLGLVVLAAWIGFFGTYQDVMGAAVTVGAPLAAILGAAVGTRFVKMVA
jgi:hypothetical protein